MTAYKIENPFEYFSDTFGNALEGGKIYIGTAGLDAQSNPIAVYFDAEETTPATQPITTTAGYPSNGGTAVSIFAASDHSITVRDSSDALIYASLNVNGLAPQIENIEAKIENIEAKIETYPIPFDTVDMLVNDAVMSYTAGTGLEVVTVGQYVMAGGYRYIVAAIGATDSGIQNSAPTPVKLYPQPNDDGGYTDLAWNPSKDGATDDAAVYQKIASALPNGANLRVAGAGTRVIGSNVTFAQDNLTVTVDGGAVFLRGDNTQSLDTVVEFSGDFLRLTGGVWDANVAGNTGEHTGRAQTLLLSGDYARTYDLNLSGSQNSEVQNVSTALYVTGRHGVFTGTMTFETGSNAIRDQGDYNEYISTTMINFGQHGFTKDSGYDDAASNLTTLRETTAITNKSQAIEAILFDHDGVKGKRAIVLNTHIEAPNMTGPDCIKFAYLEEVLVNGLYASHAAVSEFNVSIRVQQSVDSITLTDVSLAGSINFDADRDVTVIINGKSVIGRDMPVPAAVEDLRGTLTVADGVEFRNLSTAAISTDSSSFDFKIDIGRVVYHGAVGFTPTVVKPTPVTGRRLGAGQITVRPPLDTLGTMKSLEANGRWIALSDTQDSVCAQAGDRSFLGGNSDVPPREGEGFVASDTVRKRLPSPGDTTSVFYCTTGGAASANAWAGSTSYGAGVWRYNGSNVYAVVTAGTSASSGGPTGTGSAITDGTVVWRYVDTLAVFTAI